MQKHPKDALKVASVAVAAALTTSVARTPMVKRQVGREGGREGGW